MSFKDKTTKAFKYLFDSDYRFCVRASHGMCNNMTDEEYLKRMFKAIFGYELDLNNPQTYNEKLQWLKLYDRNPIYTTMVDKYAVKEYVASIIGEEYIIPTLGVWDKFEDIDFDKLPKQFVLKCTHDSGGLVICKDIKNLDFEMAKEKINKSLSRNFYYIGREWPYKNVKPKIIAEKYMEDKTTAELRDYKFFCFDGVAKALFIASDRQTDGEETKFDFYDMKFNHLDFTNGHPNAIEEIDKLATFDEMRKLAEKLSQNIPHVRVDFYEVNGKTYFGELTFSHWSGFVPFNPQEWDFTFGSWIKLPEKFGGGYALVKDGLVLYLHQGAPIIQLGTSVLNDYKIYTFNGKARLCMINQDRGVHTRADYFDQEYNWKDFTWGYDHAETPPLKPENYEKMLQLAERLASGTTELRVDFYQINGKIYFGELTFFDGSGFDKIEPITWDYELGSWIDLGIVDTQDKRIRRGADGLIKK